MINIQDKVQVKLTSTGAATLNDLNRLANTGFLLRSSVHFRTDYKENEIYSDRLWHLMKVFGDKCDLGLEVPFTDLWVDDEELK